MGKISKADLTPEIILGRLRAHLNEGRPVTLYNTYKGVPITYEAEVAMIHHDFVGMIVHPYQAVCIKDERRTYIESKSIPALIRAYPMSIDYTNQVVMLNELKIPKSISNDLQNSWVSPKKSIAVEVSSEDQDVHSLPLLEIAVLDNNRIRVALSAHKDRVFKRLEEVGLTFRLPGNDNLIQVQGIVNSLTKIRYQDSKRLEVDGKAAMGDEISILAYIAKREDQIREDLDKAYQKLRRGKLR